jgi:hypothetical protein
MAKAKRIEDIDKNLQPQTVQDDRGLRWLSAHDARFTMRGLPWHEENGQSFCRLPHRAEPIVRDNVWALAQAPASAHLAFRSNTSALAVRVRNSDTGFMPHMPLSGSNGLFLFGGPPHRLQPWATAIPEIDSPTFERELFRGAERRTREFRLYLPLYKHLVDLEIGVAKGARILAPSATAVPKPVVFYGTSITQGGCASTAGSDFVSTVGRMLNLETINLGFSGNGWGEPELAELVAEVDASLFVLDYCANVDDKRLRRTLPRFVRILRQAHPQTPILLMTPLCFSKADFQAAMRTVLEHKRDTVLRYYCKQRQAGDENIHVADGFGLLPFGAATAYVDGVHPTDDGFQMIARNLKPYLEYILLRDDCL